MIVWMIIEKITLQHSAIVLLHTMCWIFKQYKNIFFDTKKIKGYGIAGLGGPLATPPNIG